MDLIIEPNYERLSQRASRIVTSVILDKPNSLLILPSGDTPMGMYRQLTKEWALSKLDPNEVRILVLDEWVGFGPDHPMSCQWIIRKAFSEPLGLPNTSFHALNGAVKDPLLECQRYNELLNQIGPADMAILGLGLNGHIGLNEPARQLTGNSHVAKLAPTTIARVTKQMEDDHVPIYGLTLGMAQIMQARQVLLLASGRQKANAVNQMLAAPITTEFPASLLQMHPAVIFLIDESAAELLGKRPIVT